MATFKEISSALNLLYNTELSVPVDIESYIDFPKFAVHINCFCAITVTLRTSSFGQITVHHKINVGTFTPYYLAWKMTNVPRFNL